MAGKDNWEAACIDQIIDLTVDQLNDVVKVVFEKDEEKKVGFLTTRKIRLSSRSNCMVCAPVWEDNPRALADAKLNNHLFVAPACIFTYALRYILCLTLEFQ